MRKFAWLIFGVLLVLVTACSNEANVWHVERLQWTPFQWEAAEVGGKLDEKAAIMLPVEIDGQDEGGLLMQLDTGCWSTQFYERPFQLLDKSTYRVQSAANGRPAVVQCDATIGSLPIKRALVAVKLEYGTSYQSLQEGAVLGTLGLDIFNQHVLVIDFPNQRLCVLDSVSDLPAEIAASASFVPAGLAQGWFTVKAVAAGRSLDLFFDTGASSSPLVVTSALWRQLTNRAGDEPDVQRLLAFSWGDQPEVLGAPVMGELKLGPFQADGVSVYQVAEFDQVFTQAGVDGLIGNALFYDDYVVILDLKEMRFGLAKLD